MAFIQKISNEERSRSLKNIETNEEDGLHKKEIFYVNTLKSTYSNKIEELLGSKINQDKILKEAIENVQRSKQILNDKTTILSQIKEKNKSLVIQIKYANQWCNKVTKRMIETHEYFKTVNSITVTVKSLTTLCTNEQIHFNQVEDQLLKLSVQENNRKYEQIQDKDNIINMIEREKLNMVEFNKKFEIESIDINNKIEIKNQIINSLKQKINDLKFKNITAEYRNNTVLSKIDTISLERNIVDLNWNALHQNIKFRQNNIEIDRKINILNDSCRKNAYFIMNLENNTKKIKNEINTGNELLSKMTNNISEVNKNISNIGLKLILFKAEIKNLKEKYQTDQNKNNIIKLSINKKQNVISEKQNQNNNLNKELLELQKQIVYAKSINNTLNITSLRLKDELLKKENELKKNITEFENKIIAKKRLIEENNSTNIKNEIQLIVNKITELHKQHELEVNNYNLINESGKQMNTNLKIDKLYKTKHLLENKIQEVKLKINEQKQQLEERNKQFEQENEIKFGNFNEQTKIYMKEMMRVNQMNEENREEKLDKLKKKYSYTKLQLFGLKTKKLNLIKDLDLQIKKMNKIQDKKESKQNMQQDAGNENNPNDDFSTSVAKKQKINQIKNNVSISESDCIVFGSKKLRKLKRKRKFAQKNEKKLPSLR